MAFFRGSQNWALPTTRKVTPFKRLRSSNTLACLLTRMPCQGQLLFSLQLVISIRFPTHLDRNIFPSPTQPDTRVPCTSSFPRHSCENEYTPLSLSSARTLQCFPSKYHLSSEIIPPKPPSFHHNPRNGPPPNSLNRRSSSSVGCRKSTQKHRFKVDPL
jgi:hypothetical protein